MALGLSNRTARNTFSSLISARGALRIGEPYVLLNNLSLNRVLYKKIHNVLVLKAPQDFCRDNMSISEGLCDARCPEAQHGYDNARKKGETPEESHSETLA